MDSKKHLSKLNRDKAHRTAVKKNLLTSLVLYEHVSTTRSRAKAVIPLFDKLISVSRKADPLAKRKLGQMLFDQNAVSKVMEVFKPRFKNDKSGFISLYKLGNRSGDNAEMVQMFVKGYTYKDIGTKSKEAGSKKSKKTKKQEKQADEVGPSAMRDTARSSQVKADSVQGKAKSRSGI
ncbi:MAG: 50S ribosomal protein L17 [Candidatus Dojkabacteria bacterium]